MAERMRVRSEAPPERGTAQRAAPDTLSLVAICATGAWEAVVVAQTGTWFNAAGTFAALTAAALVGRWPERRRMARLMVFWILTGALIDVHDVWPGSAVAVTIWLLGRSLNAPAYAQMALAYPFGRMFDRVGVDSWRSRASSASRGA